MQHATLLHATISFCKSIAKVKLSTTAAACFKTMSFFDVTKSIAWFTDSLLYRSVDQSLGCIVMKAQLINAGHGATADP